MNHSTTRQPTTPSRAHPPRRPSALAAALPATVLVGLDASAVNVALPAIGRALGGSTAGLQWIVDAYTLMFAALLLSAGAISDRLGAKRVFAVGLAVFTLSSVTSGFAPGLGLLVGSRLVQGAAAAVLLPTSLALVRQAYDDPHERAGALSLWSVGGAVSIAAGPVLGGVLTSALGWRWIFWINVPVGLAALVVAGRAARSPRRNAAFDPAGQATAVIALAALTFGVIEGGATGFGRPLVLGALVLAVLAATAFLLVERRVAEPMVPPGVFRSRVVRVSVAVGFALNAAYYGSVFVLGLFFQEILGRSAVVAGLLFVPMTGMIAVGNVFSARAGRRFGKRVPIIAGQLVAAVSPLALLGTGAHTGLPLIAVALVPFGAGVGFAVPSLVAAMLDDLPADRAGMAGGVLNTGRQVGGALAVAGFGVLVAHRAGFGAGLHLTMLISAVLLLATAATSFALPRRHAR
ncbi:MFS transporter [Streptomyces sp. SL13]|uniref:MFS transporter n=1 Tax=Streptantibioticus silvisoli TaxID=2705255 RepID=A0AA90HBX3_9ACTN|nr:MFS transporter [Streptantibioticus silvisoli]MDI5974528.1 MFS transporter [Streptantibioticus silvisoli]